MFMHPAFSFGSGVIDMGPERGGALGDAKSDLSDKIYETVPEKTAVVMPALVGGAIGAGLGVLATIAMGHKDTKMRIAGAGAGAATGAAFSVYGSWVGAKGERRAVADYAADELLKGKTP